MTYILSFVVVLGLLIFVHELGHFLVARLCGVGVEKFSLGFGPRIFGKKIGMTEYLICAIPLGGYVKMVGEEPGAEIDPADIPISFTHKHVLQRILIVAAGPLSNFLLAVVIFFGFFQIYGTFILKPVIGEVRKGAPAERAGLVTGDEIISIDETPVSSWEDMAKIITESNGKRLSTAIRRGESEITLSVTPELTTDKNVFGEEIERYVIGISSSGDVLSIKLNPLQAMSESLIQTYKVSQLMVVGIIKLIKGDISTKNLGGPIMIVQMAGDQAKEGAGNLIYFIAFISINLAILNFLPIPVLDGGHLFFFFIELVIGRPVNLRIREIAQQVGVFMLILLMVFVFYNDIARIFFS
ncbi:MAG: RIP metalloprotease RseP [Deltaproteobacteria bacterium]|nr:RIP metalloprotease RseP [Deltaproteobacteria bacterium]MBW2192586.1 RIP metalloprotease RseP [Deltaproteobacteria bacterium]